MTTTASVTAVASLIFGLAMVAPAHAENACGSTARGADRACKAEANADFGIALGNCENLASKDARQPCRTIANASFKEAKADCADRSDSRMSLCDALGKEPYNPPIDQASFLLPADTFANPNPYFPLKPGNTWTYTGGGETNVVTVTNTTKVIDGVAMIVVHDVVNIGGQVHEETDDFYAQHVDGSEIGRAHV